MDSATTFNVKVQTDWAAALPRWRDLAAACVATPFQGIDWLDAWYRHVAPAAAATPRLVTVTDAASGGLIMLLPLANVSRRTGLVLKFADEDLSDFNAPLLGPVAVAEGAETTLWRALTAALPGHAVAEFRKMPPMVEGRLNPFSRLPGAQTSSLAGNTIALPASFAAYHASLARRVRMEFERCWRVLEREATASFALVSDPDEAIGVLSTMDRQQRERLADVGAVFSLDEPAQAAFYRDRLAERLATGTLVIAQIKADQTTIATLYAVRRDTTAVILRISHAGQAWSRVSPGRLVVHRSIAALHDLGCRTVDLSIGDYAYKQRFGTNREPLVDLVAAMSWRGQVSAKRHLVVGALRAYPALDSQVRNAASRLRSLSGS